MGGDAHGHLDLGQPEPLFGLGGQLAEKVVNLPLNAVKLILDVTKVEWLVLEDLLTDPAVFLSLAGANLTGGWRLDCFLFD
ncbi:MAG: hypothetical protein ACLPKI_32585 [Streptosporangiaceae bacterium]